MQDELNMENLKLPIGKYILCFIGTTKCWVWEKESIIFLYGNKWTLWSQYKIRVVWIKLENLYKTELCKDTEQFHTYKFDMIGYVNNFLNNKNYQISI